MHASRYFFDPKLRLRARRLLWNKLGHGQQFLFLLKDGISCWLRFVAWTSGKTGKLLTDVRGEAWEIFVRPKTSNQEMYRLPPTNRTWYRLYVTVQLSVAGGGGCQVTSLRFSWLTPVPVGISRCAFADFSGHWICTLWLSTNRKCPAVTPWRPLEQMSVEAFLYKFLNEKASSYQLLQMTNGEWYSDWSYISYGSKVYLLLIIIIASLTIVSEDQWGDLECLYKVCQAAITVGGLFTDTGVDERGENKRQSENDCEMKTVSLSSRGQLVNRQELVQTRLRRKEVFQRVKFWVESETNARTGQVEEKNQ